MYKSNAQRVKEYQENSVLIGINKIAEIRPDLFVGWDDKKKLKFAAYCINPNKKKIPKKLRKEFESVYHSTLEGDQE